MDDRKRVVLPNVELFERIKELVSEGHQVKFRVKGDSMNPFLIGSRDEAVVSPFTKEDIVPGTVILAKDKTGRIILHRVIRVNDTEIEMMGDGNCLGTEMTDLEHVAGVITEVVRNGRLVSCRGRGWRMASYLWGIFRPVRRWTLAFWRRILRKI